MKKAFVGNMLAALLSTGMAHASNLTIVNNTDQDSTSILNNGPCSTILGAGGTTKGHTSNVVDESLLKKACITTKPRHKGQAWVCKADVYMTPNCNATGESHVAAVTLNVNEGIQKIELNTNNTATQKFVIMFDKNTPFNVTINPASSFKHMMKTWFLGMYQK